MPKADGKKADRMKHRMKQMTLDTPAVQSESGPPEFCTDQKSRVAAVEPVDSIQAELLSAYSNLVRDRISSAISTLAQLQQDIRQQQAMTSLGFAREKLAVLTSLLSKLEILAHYHSQKAQLQNLPLVVGKARHSAASILGVSLNRPIMARESETVCFPAIPLAQLFEAAFVAQCPSPKHLAETTVTFRSDAGRQIVLLKTPPLTCAVDELLCPDMTLFVQLLSRTMGIALRRKIEQGIHLTTEISLPIDHRKDKDDHEKRSAHGTIA